MGHGKGGFCLKGSGELQKVVDEERKGPECLISKRREEQAWNQEAGVWGWGGYHKIHEMMLVGSGQQGQRSRSRLCGSWEGDCRPQKHLALGVKKAMRSPRDGARGSLPLARRLRALVLDSSMADGKHACSCSMDPGGQHACKVMPGEQKVLNKANSARSGFQGEEGALW